ncbi:MAG: oxygenase MpaB family protein [Polyangiaceae bacterium]
MLVTEADFERQVARAVALSPSPREGLFGPGSTVWRIARESILFLGAGRAALMQLAHPFVAHAIEQHSATRTDPLGRFNRTFLHVYGMIFGDLDFAVASARRVRSVHDRVHGSIDEDVGRFARGDRYRAHDTDALYWVHATLLDTAVQVFEIAHGPLPPGDRDAYVRELVRFAWMFGVPDEAIPTDWAAFQEGMRRITDSDTIAVGRPARETAQYLLTPPPSLVFGPAVRAYRSVTAGLLPPRLREAFGLTWTRADRLAFAASVRTIRASWPRLPLRLRCVPDYIEAERRLEGHPSRDRAGRAVQEALLRHLRPSD